MSPKSSNNKKQTRKRKAKACLFCGKVILRIGKHLQEQHAKEKIIQEIRKLDLKEKRRRLADLASQGNRKHNQKVMDEKNGNETIPKYQKRNKPPRCLVPCEKSGGFVQETNLQRHRCSTVTERTLTVNLPRIDPIEYGTPTNSDYASTSLNTMNNGKTSEKAQTEETVVIKPNTNFHDQVVAEAQQNIRERLTVEILDTLRDDEITEILRHDEMILTFSEEKLKGVLSLKFNNNYVSEMDHIRQQMRRAGKYLYHFRKVVKNPTLTLEESFRNQYQYHHMLTEVGRLLSDNYSHPFNITNAQKTLRNILKVFKSKQFDDETRELWRNIAKRFKKSWQPLTKQASRSKQLINETKKMVFPTARDHKRLIQHMEKHLKKYTNKKITTYREYLQLNRLVLTNVTFFNHRRSGEVARMTIDEFERREKNPNLKEYKGQLTELQNDIAKSVDIVTLKGKSSKNELVQAILLPEYQAAIQKMLEWKNQFPCLRQNKFVFGVRGYRKHHINGYKAIRKIVSEAKLKNPVVFTAGLMRKTLCTEMVYMKDLDEVTKKLLISQLGHKPSIHQDVYEEHMRSGLGQFTKLSAELFKYHFKKKGMVHDDETLLENLKIGNDRLAENESDEDKSESESGGSTDLESDIDTVNESEDGKNAPKEPLRRSSRNKRYTYTPSSYSEDNSEHTDASEYTLSTEEESEDEIHLQRMKKMVRSRKRRKIRMVKWSSTMNGILKEIFSDELENKDLPIRSKKLQNCQSRFTKEAGITVSTSSIKSTLFNIRHGHRRLETPSTL